MRAKSLRPDAKCRLSLLPAVTTTGVPPRSMSIIKPKPLASPLSMCRLTHATSFFALAYASAMPTATPSCSTMMYSRSGYSCSIPINGPSLVPGFPKMYLIPSA